MKRLFLLLGLIVSVSTAAQPYNCRSNSQPFLNSLDANRPFSIRAVFKFHSGPRSGKTYAVVAGSKSTSRGAIVGFVGGTPQFQASSNGRTAYSILGRPLSAAQRKGVISLSVIWNPRLHTLRFIVNGVINRTVTLRPGQLKFKPSSARERIGCLDARSEDGLYRFPGDVYSVQFFRRTLSSSRVKRLDAEIFKATDLNIWSDIPVTANGDLNTTILTRSMESLAPALSSYTALLTHNSLQGYRHSYRDLLPKLRQALQKNVGSGGVTFLRVAIPGYNLMKKFGFDARNADTMAEAAAAIAQQYVSAPKTLKTGIVLDDFMSFKRTAAGVLYPSHLEFNNLGKVCSAIRSVAPTLPVTALLYCGGGTGLMQRQIDAIASISGDTLIDGTDQISGFTSYLARLKSSDTIQEQFPLLPGCITGVEIFVSNSLAKTYSPEQIKSIVQDCQARIRQFDPTLTIRTGIYLKKFEEEAPVCTSAALSINRTSTINVLQHNGEAIRIPTEPIDDDTPGPTVPPIVPTVSPPTCVPADDDGLIDFTSPTNFSLVAKAKNVGLVKDNLVEGISLFGLVADLMRPAGEPLTSEHNDASLLRTRLLPALIGTKGDTAAIELYSSMLSR